MACTDDEGSSFGDAIGAELFKISAFHAEKEEQLEVRLSCCSVSIGRIRVTLVCHDTRTSRTSRSACRRPC